MDKLGTLIIIAFFALCVWWIIGPPNPGSDSESESRECMAPLETGTYDAKIPYGRCNKKSLKRTPCSVGNCPLGSTVSDRRYCGIQCAQEISGEDRAKCQKHCMGMMRGGCR